MAKRITPDSLLKRVGVTPDPTSGRFLIAIPIHHPTEPGIPPIQKFRLTEGRILDAYNHEWTPSEFEQALREAGMLPVFSQPDSVHCVVCGNDLAPRQSRFCSAGCRTEFRREEMRRRRGAANHECVCAVCGKQIKVGRPRISQKAS